MIYEDCLILEALKLHMFLHLMPHMALSIVRWVPREWQSHLA